MKKVIFLVSVVTLIFDLRTVFAQDDLMAGNEIKPKFFITLLRNGAGFTYNYVLTNEADAKQEIYRFLLLPSSAIIVDNLRAPEKWYIGIHNEDSFIINCVASNKNIKPGNSLGKFSFHSVSIPGIITFYAEGEHPLPSFPEGMATDSIPGYSDLTPYGPGVIGKTVGPVVQLEPFIHLTFLDTLLSYARQSTELGWLGRDRDNDCDNDEKPEDGIVRNIEKRLQKAKRELERRDSVLARRELEKLLSKVERLWKRSQDDDKKGKRDRWEKRDKVVMTSEAYVLLKYNTEYLIDRLPDRKPKKSSKDKD